MPKGKDIPPGLDKRDQNYLPCGCEYPLTMLEL